VDLFRGLWKHKRTVENCQYEEIIIVFVSLSHVAATQTHKPLHKSTSDSSAVNLGPLLPLTLATVKFAGFSRMVPNRAAMRPRLHHSNTQHLTRIRLNVCDALHGFQPSPIAQRVVALPENVHPFVVDGH
jgi:hypothetical protein